MSILFGLHACTRACVRARMVDAPRFGLLEWNNLRASPFASCRDGASGFRVSPIRFGDLLCIYDHRNFLSFCFFFVSRGWTDFGKWFYWASLPVLVFFCPAFQRGVPISKRGICDGLRILFSHHSLPLRSTREYLRPKQNLQSRAANHALAANHVT